MAEFVTVASVDDLKPGERLVAEVGRDWVIIFNVGGTYYAVEDMCSHEEYYLSEGELDGTALECPKHGACFDITTGKHLTPPAVSPIRTFPVRVENGAIQVAKR
jgi:3-phenylpropionate/trans-cinnamate dioxygenase ferredoxin component